MNYKDTLNLPKTKFSMKANLVQREPEMQKRWKKENAYQTIRAARTACEKFILHDGPPYPTGDLHIGTGMNKVLKDIIVKYKTLRGYDAPYVPGWDCHGLPIEHKVMQELGDRAAGKTPDEIRKLCRAHAEKYVKNNKRDFTRLGVMGEWDNPYLTLKPEYEAGVLDVFAQLVGKGLVYRSLKPVHWCMSCKTALAEAELEYGDLTSPSIYVNFEFADDVTDLFPETKGLKVSCLIWTTTPWTLPANLAIALAEKAGYSAVKYTHPGTKETQVSVFATALVDAVMREAGVTEYKEVGNCTGKDLEGKTYKHAFLDRTSPVILANYVSLEDGTGCVHTAPGHGTEDYMTGTEYGLDILSPVDENGVLTDAAGPFKGMNVFDADPVVTQHLVESGHMLAHGMSSHSYPHCWRCRRPVIFRATEQWFVSIDKDGFRQKLLDEIRNVRWIPSWGEGRISGMVESRPDWCISRQRFWGVPIPAFFCKKCKTVLLTKESVERVRDVFRSKGADYWFTAPAADLLGGDFTCATCGAADFEKENDIFDVWFESGSSHRSVVMERECLRYPADLYLEGTDQHRGWFQLTLVPAFGAWGKAPYRQVLTHGFVVDERGEKMSKSLGNFLSVEDVMREFGADIFRLWTSSVDYRDEMCLSKTIIARMSDAYRRIRNTFRYLLGNLSDFDPAKDRRGSEDFTEIDRWALGKAHRLVKDVEKAYDAYEFHKVFHLVHNFCTVEMSSFYLDILKDRMYTETADSGVRRAAQTVFYEVLGILTRLLAPVLVHTCEEALLASPGAKETDRVHLLDWPEIDERLVDDDLDYRWQKMIKVRQDVAREMEDKRAGKVIGSSLEASVTIATEDDKLYEFLKSFETELPTLFIASAVKLVKGALEGGRSGVNFPALSVTVERTPHEKCERCWNHFPTVGADKAHPTLCKRCAGVVGGNK